MNAPKKATIATVRAAIRAGCEVRQTKATNCRVDDGYDITYGNVPASAGDIARILGLDRSTKYRVSRNEDGALVVAGEYYFLEDFLVTTEKSPERVAYINDLLAAWANAEELRARFYDVWKKCDSCKNRAEVEDVKQLAKLCDEIDDKTAYFKEFDTHSAYWHDYNQAQEFLASDYACKMLNPKPTNVVWLDINSLM